MPKLNAKTLFNSKWTAVAPENQEKHFIVIRIETKKSGAIHQIQMQAIMTQRRFFITQQELQDQNHWQPGWH